MAIPHWCILIGGTLALLLRSVDPRRFVLAVIFTLPFNGAFVEVGQRVELFKVASLLALPIAAYHLPRLLAGGVFGGLGPFASWAAWITLFTFCMPPEYLANEGDGMRSLGLRLLLQGTLLFSRLALVGLCILALRRSCDVITAVRVWVAATTLLAGFGLIEEAGRLAGFDVGGVFYDGLLNGSPTHLDYQLAGVNFKRIGSFAHEPKMLARWLIPSLAVLLCDAANGNRLTGRGSRTRLLITVHLAALIFTFSTSGYLILMASLAIPLLALGNGLAAARYLGILAVGAAALGLGGLNVDTLIEAVITEKSAKYGGFVQGGSDGPAFAFLEAYPWAAVWGSGLSTQGFYLPEFITADFEFVYENVMERGFGGFGVESGWLSLLLDDGLIGIVALLLPIVVRWRNGTALLHRLAGKADAAETCAAIALSRSLLAACLVGMVAYNLETAGLLAVSFGTAAAAVSCASRRLASSQPATAGLFTARARGPLTTGLSA